MSPELDVDQQSVDDVETLGREDLDQISFTIFLNCLESNIPGTLDPPQFLYCYPPLLRNPSRIPSGQLPAKWSHCIGSLSSQSAGLPD